MFSANFPVLPVKINMTMHMFGAMYGVTNKFTLMGMLPYVDKTMSHLTRSGATFTTNTSGLGDIKLSGIYAIYDSGIDSDIHCKNKQVLLSFGVSLPTGGIDERDATPAGSDRKLLYSMQLRSGTVDPLFGVSYINKKHDWSLGAQAKTVLRFGKNDEGYRLGNEYGVSTWISRNVSQSTRIWIVRSWKQIINLH